MSLRDAQAAVREFMQKAQQDCPSAPSVPTAHTQELRIRLHEEEAVAELAEAFCDGNIVKVADSIADALVVVIGTAVACGIDIEPIFEEVMRSNMTKFIDGHRRGDGKWMKGPSYTPAAIRPLIESQTMINASAAAKEFGVAANTVAYWYKRGCPGIKRGGQLMVSLQEIRKWRETPQKEKCKDCRSLFFKKPGQRQRLCAMCRSRHAAEITIQTSKRFRELNREKDRAANARWRAKNPEKVRAKSLRQKLAK